MALTKVGKEGITGISNSSDATAITIDSSENVGIGATNPNRGSHDRALLVSNTGSGARSAIEIEGNSSNANGTITFLNNGTDAAAIYNRGAGNLTFNTGSSLTERMRISSDGEITKPSQPAFLVKPTSQQSNVTGDTNVTVVMDNEIFDVGANFASNTFTAPITGKYFLSFVLYGVALPGTANYLEIAITTSNRGYVNIQEPSGSEDVYAGGTVSCIADMDANDTAFARITIGGSSSQFDIGTTSTFSGALIC